MNVMSSDMHNDGFGSAVSRRHVLKTVP